jgi:hypothetical protein
MSMWIFVVDKEIAADERARGVERPSMAVSRIEDYVRNDAVGEVRIGLIGKVSGIVTLAERVFACVAVSPLGSFSPPNPLVGCKSLVEHKTLTSLISVRTHAAKEFTDIKEQADEPDRHPGSTFVHELNLYGSNLSLVTGPFGNLSSDFSTFVDFVARKLAR